MKLYWLPVSRAVSCRGEVEHGPAVHCVSRIPLATDGELGFSVSVDVASSHADMISLSEMSANLVFFPTRILIPSHFVLVHQHNVGLAVAIHVGELQAVTDANFDVDVLLAKLGLFGQEVGENEQWK